MSTMQTRYHVRADGLLKLQLPAEARGTDVDLTVAYQPAKTEMDAANREEWLRFIDETAGSISDDTFRRHDQGVLEQRP